MKNVKLRDLDKSGSKVFQGHLVTLKTTRQDDIFARYVVTLLHIHVFFSFFSTETFNFGKNPPNVLTWVPPKVAGNRVTASYGYEIERNNLRKYNDRIEAWITAAQRISTRHRQTTVHRLYLARVIRENRTVSKFEWICIS